jgi:Domain of unknown function (DUF222)/HNH endonuclease
MEHRIEHRMEPQLKALDAAHRELGSGLLAFLGLIRELDEAELWRTWGARDTAHLLSMRYDISHWKALRWLAAAHALERLPRLAQALSSGDLGLDKVVELARFASAETEAGLIRWARTVSCAAVRHRGDLAIRAKAEEVIDAEHARSVSWWFCDEGRRFGLEANLPAAQGAIVARALERIGETLPVMPDEDVTFDAAARRADALVALSSARLADDADPDRATVVVHATLDDLRSGTGGYAVEDGPVLHTESAERLFCNARVQTVVEDRSGNVIGLGRTSRQPSPWMIRQVRYRDRECRFPGCGSRRFTEAHHIVWWRNGGRTDLDNLLLICSFHHRLVHEYGWRVNRELDGQVTWHRRDGTRYRAGPSPNDPHEPVNAIAAAG